jgi:hypothetical protein
MVAARRGAALADGLARESFDRYTQAFTPRLREDNPGRGEKSRGCGDFLAERDLWLANCYFAHDSLGFPVLLPFFNGQSGRAFYPLDRHHGPVARTGWGPFHSCGVPSTQAPTPPRKLV